MIVSVSEIEKEQRKSFVRTKEICKKKERRVFIKKEKEFHEETCRQLGIRKVRDIEKVIFLNGWMRKI